MGRASKQHRRTTSTPVRRDGDPLSSLAPDRPLLGIALRFFVLFAVLQAAIWWLAARGYLERLLDVTTVVAGGCVAATGLAPQVSGNRIALTTRILQIDLDCTGISLAAVFAALVLAYPLRWQTKVIGLVAGLPLLAAANLARLTAVAHLSERLGEEAFGFVHDYLFMVAMVAVVVGLWAAYLALARRYAARA